MEVEFVLQWGWFEVKFLTPNMGVREVSWGKGSVEGSHLGGEILRECVGETMGRDGLISGLNEKLERVTVWAFGMMIGWRDKT